jgi:ssDNA-binding Zn-finger/Zn-ribbon topoisomerase 1
MGSGSRVLEQIEEVSIDLWRGYKNLALHLHGMMYNKGEEFLAGDRREEQIKINCPNCDSNDIRKNGQRRGKQNYQCKNCGRQFIESYSPRGYSQEVKEACLYV